jgi:hypothetical protein
MRSKSRRFTITCSMTNPHLFFLHFWANDDAKKLAEGLKAALAHVNVAKS